MMMSLKYPIGEFSLPGSLDAKQRASAIDEIATTPKRLREVVDGLSEIQLDTRYRPDGWTVRQVVHHLPDSHLNSYVRMKLALTETVPVVRTYEEARWAELADSSGPVELSLSLLEALHQRWIYLWQRLDAVQWNRRFRHPDLGEMRVDELAAFYAWHGNHHIAHVASLRTREGWLIEPQQ